MDITDEEKAKKLDRLITVIEKTYHHPGSLMWRSWISGLMSGLGATMGVAIILALVGFLIRQFGGLPVIGAWLNDLGRILPTHR